MVTNKGQYWKPKWREETKTKKQCFCIGDNQEQIKQGSKIMFALPFEKSILPAPSPCRAMGRFFEKKRRGAYLCIDIS